MGSTEGSTVVALHGGEPTCGSPTASFPAVFAPGALPAEVRPPVGSVRGR